MEILLLLTHPATGVLAMLASVWVFVDTLNYFEGNQARINKVSMLCAVLMWLTYLIGGYWYMIFCNADKAVIKAGPWAFGHRFFMEVKEHLFLMLILQATYLPSFGQSGGAANPSLRQRAMTRCGSQPSASFSKASSSGDFCNSVASCGRST